MILKFSKFYKLSKFRETYLEHGHCLTCQVHHPEWQEHVQGESPLKGRREQPAEYLFYLLDLGGGDMVSKKIVGHDIT